MGPPVNPIDRGITGDSWFFGASRVCTRRPQMWPFVMSYSLLKQVTMGQVLEQLEFIWTPFCVTLLAPAWVMAPKWLWKKKMGGFRANGVWMPCSSLKFWVLKRHPAIADRYNKGSIEPSIWKRVYRTPTKVLANPNRHYQASIAANASIREYAFPVISW